MKKEIAWILTSTIVLIVLVYSSKTWSGEKTISDLHEEKILLEEKIAELESKIRSTATPNDLKRLTLMHKDGRTTQTIWVGHNMRRHIRRVEQIYAPHKCPRVKSVETLAKRTPYPEVVLWAWEPQSQAPAILCEP